MQTNDMTTIERHAEEIWEATYCGTREGIMASLKGILERFKSSLFMESRTLEDLVAGFRSAFVQDLSGERVSGYLTAPSVRGSTKIAIPSDIEPWIRNAWHLGRLSVELERAKPCPTSPCPKTPVGKCVACHKRDTASDEA